MESTIIPKTATAIFLPDDSRVIQEMGLENNYQEIVTLCGSTRFYKEYAYAQYRLSLQGIIALSCGCFGQMPKDIFGFDQTVKESEKVILDELHKRKIDLSHRILVICPDNYIGESTRSEILYTLKLNKPVWYWKGNNHIPDLVPY